MSKTQDNGTTDEDGLTATEREYLTTPISKMTPDQRMIAMACKEKKNEKIWADNAVIREAEKKANALADAA